MNISLGADHGGFNLKQQIKQYLISLGHNVLDKGTDSMDSCNYALFARAAAECVANKEADFAIVVCTSGEGVSMAANKVKGVRCGLVYNKEVAKLIRLHNNANAMALAAKFTTFDEAKEYINTFLTTEFEGGRHIERVNSIEK